MKQLVMRSAGLVAVAALLALGATVAAAQDKPAEPPAGRVIFVRGDALFAAPGDGKGSEQELVKLPADFGAVRGMEASRDGKLIVVRGDKGSAWLTLGETTWHTGCSGRARPSPTSECLICELNGVVTLLGAKQSFAVKLPGTWHDVNFLGSARELAALDAQKGVLGFGVQSPKQTRLLAKPGASGYLLVAPDGSKAVAVFGHGATSRVHGFVLDGEGIPRSLGGPAVPLVWSVDSTWALLEYGIPAEDGVAPESVPPIEDEDDQGDEGEGGGEGALWPRVSEPWLMAAGRWIEPKLMAGKSKKKKKDSRKKKQIERAEPAARVRTCVVRAVGGESKCWNHYSPRAFAPSSDRVLLWKDSSLWVGKIPGVRPETPKRIVENASGPAVWVP
jgi:hypothetical protein